MRPTPRLARSLLARALLAALALSVACARRAGVDPAADSGVDSAADPAAIVRRLEVARDVAARRALVLALGDHDGARLPDSLRARLVPRLLAWYRDDPDPGVHAAVGWLLRHARQGTRPRALDWGRAEALARIDRELAGAPAGARRWYVTREGQTMTIVRGPVELSMGSPAHEAGRTPDEMPARVRIPRSFAIGATEVTVAQFRRFLDASPEVARRHAYPGAPGRMAEVLAAFAPDDDAPRVAMTWYEAAAYCNWLSAREGIPRAEWVYPADPDSLRDGMTLPADHLRRTGYRLPTEAEWEYAARAGTTTARFFGESAAPLARYAWYAAHPLANKGDSVHPDDPTRTWPVGQLLPNALGLFDVYGNAWEWGHDRRREWSAADSARDDVEDPVLLVRDSVPRTRRGGSFAYGADVMRSAHRGAGNYLPGQRRDNVGFRVARTVR